MKPGMDGTRLNRVVQELFSYTTIGRCFTIPYEMVMALGERTRGDTGDRGGGKQSNDQGTYKESFGCRKSEGKEL